MSYFGNALRRFRRDEKGQLLVETVLVLPILIWAYLSLFTYWDAFRALNTFQKASYSISDVLSRNQGVTPTYVAGLQTTMDYLVDADTPVKMRVTSVVFSALRNRFEVEWSNSPGGAMTPLTTSTLQTYAASIPAMTDGNTVVIVETEMNYTPTFQIGADAQVFKEFVVTRPRFYARVVLNS